MSHAHLLISCPFRYSLPKLIREIQQFVAPRPKRSRTSPHFHWTSSLWAQHGGQPVLLDPQSFSFSWRRSPMLVKFKAAMSTIGAQDKKRIVELLDQTKCCMQSTYFKNPRKSNRVNSSFGAIRTFHRQKVGPVLGFSAGGSWPRTKCSKNR